MSLGARLLSPFAFLRVLFVLLSTTLLAFSTFLRLTPEELTLTKSHLGFEFLDLLFQEDLALNGLCMARFPVSNLRSEHIDLLCQFRTIQAISRGRMCKGRICDRIGMNRYRRVLGK